MLKAKKRIENGTGYSKCGDFIVKPSYVCAVTPPLGIGYSNWEPCMRCGRIKIRKFVLSSSPPLGISKFNVDGSARGKLGPAGIGDVLHNSKGEVFFMYSKFAGICHSNEAEVLSILEALRCFYEEPPW
eukprot:TRINITY_DN23314_c0_g1_i1.p1 TRINITY_DN23314_c0_g1~~TRINITY_DN23314_c0_g1_i1.p1  ORF type:complete len:129 (+),score=18.19 TRINITY_DN23314_c0_g1_i1:303-689(+)